MAGLTNGATDNVLEQSPSFRPFMWESIILPTVTGRAGNHHIVDVMTRDKFRTGNRNGMIEMIDIRSILALRKLTKAIIAGILLGFQFGLNLLHRQHSLKVSLAYMPFLLSKTLLSKMLFAVALIVLLLPDVDFFTMGGAIAYRICKHLFSMPLIIPFVIFRMGISIDFFVFARTVFTTWLQSISASIEELSRRREIVQALCTSFLRGFVLGYTVHDKGHSLSGSGCFSIAERLHVLPLHYTTNQPHKLV